jgi:hypothetical protein
MLVIIFSLYQAAARKEDVFIEVAAGNDASLDV